MSRITPGFLVAALATLLSLLLIATSIDTRNGFAGNSSTAAQLGPGVPAAFGTESSVGVIVALRQPSALRSRRVDLRTLRSQVAAEQDQIVAGLSPSDFRETRRYAAVPAIAGRVSPAGLKALQARADIVQVALDGVGDAGLTQTVPLIHADETFAAGVTGAGETVAVIDTGIDTDHPDLSDSIAYEVCFLSPMSTCPPDPHPAEDDNGHGTNVAGIITSNGTVAPRGVAPDAKIAAYKVLDSAGGGFFSDWLAALDDIIANHPEVNFVNMSLQSGLPCPNAALQTAIATLRHQGVGTFIASGNHGTKDSFMIPSCITEGISVGAVYDSNVGSSPALKSGCSPAQLSTTAADVVACWSDSTPDLDLLAPGAYVTSTGRSGGLSTFLGTSQASPHAAGVAALLKQAIPSLSVDDVEARMKSTGTIITDDLADSDPSTNRQTPRIDARVALLTDDSADYDGDGCTNGQEFGPDQLQGGKRNPLSPWDYMDPTGDGRNRVNDILFVLAQYFKDDNDANPGLPPYAAGYNPDTDRTLAGPYPWSLGPPNGMQRIDDVLASLSQYFHDCRH